ncbi:MAG: ABC-type transport auxiliary lipoprotein family protein [Phenylobacterium sp.]|uniref:ABC-type transport auxiliary lipoprotein family protein n=1 Tax=Phenylobacterium sp. TaxID=1871053 RepID=UPI00271E0471|nr:ABC-type transport auxiliary lipoprotein family protein [Phenylobacterium sp.]MDO8912800.1 ABC-type transport auxiliary lipoprotein family protein [Phenylobacterium sp.]MDP3101601.1 ABC-type transport auxiliary lipoprotein family protein [Phenylobacterium sp.]
MTRLQRLIRLSAVALTAVALSGCISLFPKSKPANLYRFDYLMPAEAASPPRASGEKFGVLKLSNEFNKAAAGDRIMTVTAGSDVAYIAEARWVSPASVLFDEAVSRAFDQDGRSARLISRGEIGQSDYVLKLDVRDFQVNYAAPKGRPSVVVNVHAVLTRSADRSVAAERTFSQTVAADGDRQADIVRAFTVGVSGVLRDLVEWTSSLGKAAS